MKKIILIIIVSALIIGGILIGLNIGKSNKANTTNSVNNNSVAQSQSNTQNNTNTTIANNSQATENKTETKNNAENTENTENTTEKKNNTQSTENKTKVDNTQNEQNEIKGVWQYPDSTYPDEELIIKSTENNKITFDYIIDGITSFDNVEASLDKNIATFDVKNDGGWNIKGTMTFKDNTLIFNIKESSNEYIPVKTTTFSIKTNKSVLQ